MKNFEINKKKLSNIRLLIIILLLFAFYFSCNDDNPLKNNLINELDTISRFDWKYDDIENSKMLDIYMADSSNIFLMGYPNPLYYNGTNYEDINLNDPDFFPTSLEGYNKQNVYIGGGLSGKRIAVLKKIQEKTILSYEIPDRPAGRIDDILIQSENDVWLATDNSFVYKLSAGTFTKYNVMQDSWWGIFYWDNINDLYFINDIYPKSSDHYYRDYYKLINDSFNLVLRDTVCMFCETDYSLFRCGDDLLKVNNEISYFRNLEWIKICDTKLTTGEKLLPKKIAGKSKDYFVCYSSSVNSPGIDGIFIWSDNNWSWERNLSQNWPERGVCGGIELRDDRIAFVINRETPLLSQSSTVIKGILK